MMRPTEVELPVLKTILIIQATSSYIMIQVISRAWKPRWSLFSAACICHLHHEHGSVYATFPVPRDCSSSKSSVRTRISVASL
mmetsp:Transcript_52902/g.123828  ORF Transcript_52902/g.123828 Transcript_52902/m.123828 type:complete len:83 (+) Transcript_52902:621-869(+)